MRKKIPFTKEGFKKLQKEYDELLSQRVPAVAELSEARDMGDRSENAAYKSARWKLSSLDRRLRQLKNLLRNAEVIERAFTGKVDIGCRVTLFDGRDTFKYTIVGGYESDPILKRISIHSPIGKALLGKKPEETIIVDIPAGKAAYKIIAVDPE